MLKVLILFLFFVFLNPLFGANSTVVYVNGSYNCVYMAKFWQDSNHNLTVGYQLVKGGTITSWWTADTGTQQPDRPIYTDTKVYFNVPNCELNSSSMDLFPAVSS